MARPKKPLAAAVAAVRALNPKARFRLKLGVSALVAGLATFAACGGCRGNRAADPGAAGSAARSSAPPAGSARARAIDAAASDEVEVQLWASARDGDLEDLAALATHSGAAGLLEGADDPARRATALRAMGFARGWSQLPLLASVAGGNDDGEARLAIESAQELATRPRRSEDVEDAVELREGCDALDALARDATRPRARRVGAVRALRMLPCPASEAGGLPVDIDAK